MPRVGVRRASSSVVARVNEFVRGKRGITPNTAWLLAWAFGTSPEFWMNLQGQHELAKNRPATKVKRISAG